MPWESTPRIRAAFKTSCLPEWVFRSRAPTVAKQIFCPAATLGAPQTTSNSSVPVLTRQRRRRSAWGWGLTSTTRPTKHPLQPPVSITSPTSIPAMVSRWANSCAGITTSTYCRSQLRGTFIVCQTTWISDLLQAPGFKNMSKPSNQDEPSFGRLRTNGHIEPATFVVSPWSFRGRTRTGLSNHFFETVAWDTLLSTPAPSNPAG